MQMVRAGKLRVGDRLDPSYGGNGRLHSVVYVDPVTVRVGVEHGADLFLRQDADVYVKRADECDRCGEAGDVSVGHASDTGYDGLCPGCLAEARDTIETLGL